MTNWLLITALHLLRYERPTIPHSFTHMLL